MHFPTLQKHCLYLLQNGQVTDAEQLSQNLVNNCPENVETHILHAHVLTHQQKWADALKQLEQGYQRFPSHPTLLNQIASLCQHMGRHKDALRYYGEVLEQDQSPAQLSQCGWFMLETGHLLEAEQLLILSANQGHLKAVAGVVELRLRQNRAAEAADWITQYISVLPQEPALIHACARLMLSQKEHESALEALQLLNGTQLDTAAQITHFRLLGDTYDQRGEFSLAFEAYQTVNQLSSVRYDASQHQQNIRSIQKRFSTSKVLSQTSTCASIRPIFIVGMPRSGSSLLEQSLSMHPDIYAAGELDDMPSLIAEIGTDTPENLDKIAEHYLKRLQTRNAEAKHVTDKLPHNYIHLGEIFQIFPQARVLYCRRDPVDTGWSCYRQQFHHSLSYATDLWAIGHFHACLDELMQHWQKLHPTSILEVHYEALVQDPTTTLQQVLVHCSLDWTPAVLNFQDSKRVVHTASTLQVHQPLYTSSIGLANNYRPHLQPLLNGLSALKTDNHSP